MGYASSDPPSSCAGVPVLYTTGRLRRRALAVEAVSGSCTRAGRALRRRMVHNKKSPPVKGAEGTRRASGLSHMSRCGASKGRAFREGHAKPQCIHALCRPYDFRAINRRAPRVRWLDQGWRRPRYCGSRPTPPGAGGAAGRGWLRSPPLRRQPRSVPLDKLL